MSRIRIRSDPAFLGHPYLDLNLKNRIRGSGSGKKWTGSATLVETVDAYNWEEKESAAGVKCTQHVVRFTQQYSLNNFKDLRFVVFKVSSF